jgi:uncharacterized membrane protein YphA (DoxX/SURF4 family)
MNRKIFVEAVSVLFITLFLYTGISKIMDYAVFKEQIGSSPILASIAPLIAYWLPVVEFLVVLLLIVPRWRLKGLYACLLLMMLFTGYIIAILSFSKDLPCSCGGVLAKLSWQQHLVFNVVFMILAFLALNAEKGNRRAVKAAWQLLFNKPLLKA